MRQKSELLEIINKDDREAWEHQLIESENRLRHLKNIRKILDTLNLFSTKDDKCEALDEIHEYLEGIGI